MPDLVFLLEHNYKSMGELLITGYEMYMGCSTRLKGGVALLIKEASPFLLHRCEVGEKGQVVCGVGFGFVSLGCIV